MLRLSELIRVIRRQAEVRTGRDEDDCCFGTHFPEILQDSKRHSISSAPKMSATNVAGSPVLTIRIGEDESIQID